MAFLNFKQKFVGPVNAGSQISNVGINRKKGFEKALFLVTKLCVPILLQAPLTAWGQTYFFDNYKTTDGMESSKIYAMCQAADGFVWLGTDVGVTRFDGAQFVNYTIKQGLAKGGAKVLFTDRNNNMWIGHEDGGITRFDGKKFEQIESLPITGNITSMCQDKNGFLWITTYENGALKITNPDAAGDKLKWRGYTDKQLSDMVFNSRVARDGTLFLITDVGIKQYIAEKDSFVRYAPKGLDTYFQFSAIFDDSKGNMWYGTYNGGLYLQKAGSNSFEYFDTKNGLASNWITNIVEDKSGNIWIGHWDLEQRGGITRISPDGKLKVFDLQNGLHDNKVWCMMEDMEGNLLVGTTEHGLDIYKGEVFFSYSSVNGLANSQVNAIAEDADGNFWFGTNGGINVFDVRTRMFSLFDQKANQISNMIRFLKLDNDKNIWIGTEDQGVQLYDTHKRCFVSMPQINERLPRVSKSVYAMDIDRKNRLWIGTLGGLMLFDISTASYIKIFGQMDGLPSNEVKSVYCDRSGTVWVGCENAGICYFDGSKFVPVPMDEKYSPTAMTETGNGEIVVGTEAHGVLVMKHNGTLLKRFTINEGLYTNNIRFLEVDDESNIYVGTTVGLNKITSKGGKVMSYAAHNGFVGIESKPNAAYEDHSGRMWFGTVQGVTCYNPLNDRKSPVVPMTHIVGFEVNGQPIDINSHLEFQSYQNNVLINFGCVSVSDPTSVTYSILLGGADREWQNIGSEKSANYRSLPPGKYNFKVKAFNAYGVSDEKPVEIAFVILAPMYKRPWFVVLMLVAALISIWVYVGAREKKLVREKKLLADRVNERTHELSLANHQLAARNKDITDSILYAKRIQFAILPADVPYPETFVLFKPKDIVSGDFYWANRIHGKEFLAVVDCTGHGVPGAFMSVIGHSSLNKIIIENGVQKPADILTQLNREIEQNLHQKENDIVNDGMDIALVCYDAQTRLLQYAGANNPLWLVRNGELTEYKANRFSIGRSAEGSKMFENCELQIEPNDTIYLFTDGYADQFGGPKGKKFKISQLRRIILEHAGLPVSEQYRMYNSIMETWKGELEQVDDILMVGRRFK